jgi:hypothetical protein
VNARLPIPVGTVPIDLRDRPAWLRGIVLAAPGIIFEDEASGARLRVMPDGSLEEIVAGGHPRPGCAHSTATVKP